MGGYGVGWIAISSGGKAHPLNSAMVSLLTVAALAAAQHLCAGTTASLRPPWRRGLRRPGVGPRAIGMNSGGTPAPFCGLKLLGELLSKLDHSLLIGLRCLLWGRLRFLGTVRQRVSVPDPGGQTEKSTQGDHRPH